MTHESTDSQEPKAQIYVSDFATYNNGFLTGKWLSLDGKSVQQIRAEIAQVMKDNERANGGQWICEEVMIQDYEGFPREFYGECMVFDKPFEILVQYLALDEHARNQFEACLENSLSPEEALQQYEEVSLYDDVDDYLDSHWFWDEVPDHLRHFIDEAHVKFIYVDQDPSVLEMDDRSIAVFCY